MSNDMLRAVISLVGSFLIIWGIWRLIKKKPIDLWAWLAILVGAILLVAGLAELLG